MTKTEFIRQMPTAPDVGTATIRVITGAAAYAIRSTDGRWTRAATRREAIGAALQFLQAAMPAGVPLAKGTIRLCGAAHQVFLQPEGGRS